MGRRGHYPTGGYPPTGPARCPRPDDGPTGLQEPSLGEGVDVITATSTYKVTEYAHRHTRVTGINPQVKAGIRDVLDGRQAGHGR
jgi:hypothetical protein